MAKGRPISHRYYAAWPSRFFSVMLFIILAFPIKGMAADAPVLSYTYSPRQTGDLDRNALNTGVSFSHEPPSFFNCSYVRPTANAPAAGSITYAFKTAGEPLTNVVLSQKGVLYTQGDIAGEFSTDDGQTFQRFFETDRYAGQPVATTTRITLRNLNASTLMIRYTLSVTNGSNLNVQFLRDCDDAPFSLRFDFDAPVTLVDLPRTRALHSSSGGFVNSTIARTEAPKGTVVTVFATPLDNYVFRGWYGDVISFDDPLRITLNENTSITALFSPVAPLNNCSPSPEGMVDWWTADGDPSDARTGNEAELKRGLTYAPGFDGLGFSFDGVDDYLQIGDAPLPPPWTLVLWVFKQATDQKSVALLSNSGVGLKLEQFGTPRKVGLTQYGVKDWSFNYVVPTNTWTHLAFVADAGTMRLYVNGSPQGSIPIAVPLPREQAGIGVVDPPTDPFHGTLDEITVFKRALSADEIARISRTGSSGMCKPPRIVSAVRSSSGGEVSLRASGPLGKPLEILQSTDLRNWSPSVILNNPDGLLNFSVPPESSRGFIQIKTQE